jgi:glycosyltransferase involved in cell wall biosynthesis
VPGVGFCTIVAKNYLAQARVLMESVRKHHPHAVPIVFLADRADGCFDAAQEPFEVVTSEALELPDPRWFHFKYTVLELSTAIKPYALEFAMRRYDLEKIVYLDADIKVYAPLDGAIEALNDSNVVLTPHLTAPLEDECRPSELDILRSGAYNLGFIGVKWSEESQRFLRWWQTRLYDYCIVDLPRGLFVDQKWVDLIPGMFSGVQVLRDAGYNVAYWNLSSRPVEHNGDAWQVNGGPLYFFHFSGLDPDDIANLSRHQNRFRLGSLGGVAKLIASYCDDLFRNGCRECRTWPYAFGSFANGAPIPDAGRRIRDHAPNLASIDDPFSDEGFQAFVDYWNHPAPGESGLTRLARRIRLEDENSQTAMPDVFGGERVRFLHWLVNNFQPANNHAGAFLAPAWDALRAVKYHAPGASDAMPDSIQRDTDGQAQLTRLAMFIHDTRPDLQRIFPDPCGRDATKFLAWMLTFGQRENQIGDRFTAPLRAQWEQRLNNLDGWPARLWHRMLLRGMSLAASSRPVIMKILPARRVAKFRPSYSLNGKRGALQSVHAGARERIGPDQAVGVGLNVLGYLTAETGMGQSARALVRAAESTGLPVSCKVMLPAGPERTGDHSPISESAALPYRVNVFRINADQTPFAFSQLDEAVWRGKYNIGDWAWELEEFPGCWRRSFSYVNEVWAASSFAQDAFARKSPVPVIRIPRGVELDLNGSPRRADFGWSQNEFVFLTVFDMLSVFERKNPLAVIQAFQRAFPEPDGVRLVVKVNHPEFNRASLALLTAHAGPSISVVTESYCRSEINGLLNSCDCLVSLHRAEGFGWTLAEAMYLGKPVIATGYSGNLDFTRLGNSYLVEHRLIRIGEGCGPYDPNGLWADVDIEDASQKMREVVSDAPRRQRMAARGQELIKSQFSLQRMGTLMRERLESIQLPGRQSIIPNLRPYAERLQDPDADRDHNHHVQDGFDAAGHRDVGVDEPQSHTHN